MNNRKMMDDKVAMSVFGKRPFPNVSSFLNKMLCHRSQGKPSGFSKLPRHSFIIPGTSRVRYWNETLQDL